MTDIEYLKKYYQGNLEDAMKRLEKGEPVQYIVGSVDFYHSNFKVNKNVLIPRFETEELVEKTIKHIKQYLVEPLDIIDLGTGSGCIAISLKKELESDVEAVDISKEALEVAKENAKNNHVDITFYQGDFLEPVSKKYDVMISNPPYISLEEEIMDIVKQNEPPLALYADNQGLSCYEKILKDCKSYLKKKSLIAFEIGHKQAKSIEEMITRYLPGAKVIVEKDLQGKDRFIFIFLK